MRYPPPISQRLREAIKETPKGCWEWQKCRNSGGYGVVSYRQQNRTAHRVSFHVFNGFDLESPLDVCHSCDNPPCINPKHLFAGTTQDNMLDASAKGRIDNKGSRNARAKVNWWQVCRIRLMNDLGTTQESIASFFPVSRSMVGRILRWEYWPYLDSQSQ